MVYIDDNLYFIFPNTHKFLCYEIAQQLEIQLRLTSEKRIYDLSTLCIEDISRISISLNSKSILILAFCDGITSEVFYKLGIAFEKQISVILIYITRSRRFQQLPSYIKYDFLARLSEVYSENSPEAQVNRLKKSKDRLIIELKEYIDSILVNNDNHILYQQALNYCRNLEEKTEIDIRKVDRAKFDINLASLRDSKGIESFKKLCRDKSDDFIWGLLSCIFYDRSQIYELVTIYNTRQRKNKNSKDMNQYNISGNEVTFNKIDTQFNNHLPNANISNYANQVSQQTSSDFSQSNGENVKDVIKLVSNLRETAGKFSQEIQDDLIKNIELVEVESQKSVQERNVPKLKHSLLSLATAATVTFAAVAGMTDFANNVMEISNKLGIELILPSNH